MRKEFMEVLLNKGRDSTTRYAISVDCAFYDSWEHHYMWVIFPLSKEVTVE
jgi:hypothetical protein